MLGDDEREDFERHILENQDSFNDALELSAAAEIIRDPKSRKEILRQLSPATEKSFIPNVLSFLFQPGLLTAVVGTVVAVFVIFLIILNWESMAPPSKDDGTAGIFAEATEESQPQNERGEKKKPLKELLDNLDSENERAEERNAIDISEMRSQSVFKSAAIDMSLEKMEAPVGKAGRIDVKLVVNRQGNPPRYKVGDKIKLGLKSDTDCYIYILDVQPDGKISLLYPGGGYTENFARANEPFLIPPELGTTMRVTEPTGIERVLAAALEEPIDPAELKPEELILLLLKNIVAEIEFLVEE